MELTPADVKRYVEEYRSEEPLYPVEQEGIETLPDAFRAGEYGPRDAEWVVRWYFRRYLGEYPHDERAAIEERFADVEMGRVKAAIAEAVEAIDGANDDPDAGSSDVEIGSSDGYAEALAALTELPAVDVRVGSAFLTFLDPDTYLPIGDREWEVMSELSTIDDPYPPAPTIADYGRFLENVREIEERHEIDSRTAYMAIWRLWKEDDSSMER